MKSIVTVIFFLIWGTSYSAVVILNGLSHIHEGAAGITVSGRIKVQNNSSKQTNILIYNEDLILSCGKPSGYNKINSHNRSLGEWLKTGTQEKTLQGNESYDVHYTITIPKESKGSYWSVIMIEGADPVKEEVDQGLKIDSKVRYAILIIANAGTLENPEMGFEQMTVTPVDTLSQALKVRLRNSGIFVASAKLSMEVYDAAGKKIKTLETNPRRVYPDKCTEFELLIRDLPKGKYDGVLIADNGNDLYGANINLEIK